ncbi:MAG: DUF2167 domain-containing protein [Myxococcota bacterium]
MFKGWVLAVGLAVTPTVVFAQDGEAPALDVQPGPTEGALGGHATLVVPEGFGFVDKSEMPTLNRLTGNLDSPRDVGALLSEDGWIVFFSFDDVGYVKDDDRDALDADSMIASMKEGTEASNAARKERGYPQLTLLGWQKEPYYDEDTQNLTWSIRNQSEGVEGIGINHEVRLLGRYGVMSATLVAGSEELPAAIPQLNKILTGFSFNQGQTYAEYVQGDKVAEYGLAGLVLGGGVLLAAKTGLLGYLGKFFKFIVVGVVAAIGGIARLFRGKSAEEA